VELYDERWQSRGNIEEAGKCRHTRLGFGADLCFSSCMEPENGARSGTSQERASAGGLGSARALALGAFALGVLAGAAVATALLLYGHDAVGRLNIVKPRPRRLLIGNLEIEERGDDTRFRVD
jgi:hypothetical protein